MRKEQGRLDIAMELMEQAKSIHEHMYGLACVDCLAGRVPEALQHLEQAVAAGLSSYNIQHHIPTNHDLDVIRDEQRFKALFSE